MKRPSRVKGGRRQPKSQYWQIGGSRRKYKKKKRNRYDNGEKGEPRRTLALSVDEMARTPAPQVPMDGADGTWPGAAIHQRDSAGAATAGAGADRSLSTG